MEAPLLLLPILHLWLPLRSLLSIMKNSRMTIRKASLNSMSLLWDEQRFGRNFHFDIFFSNFLFTFSSTILSFIRLKYSPISILFELIMWPFGHAENRCDIWKSSTPRWETGRSIWSGRRSSLRSSLVRRSSYSLFALALSPDPFLLF